MPRPYVVYHWRDNNGGKAEVKIYPPEPHSFDAIVSFALTMASALQGASDARLVSFDVVGTFDISSSLPASPDADMRSYALLFYRNGDARASILVPAPRGVLSELSGPYAGIRITRDRLELLGLLPALDTLPASLRDPVGRPVGGNLTVGGIVKL